MHHPSFIAAAFTMIAPSAALGAGPSSAELAERDRWMAACFPEFEIPARPPAGELIVEERYDHVLRNTYCDSRYVIGGRTYYRGLLAHANSRITVRLPGPGESFTAIAGIDTNHMTSGGRGSVVFGVDVGDERRFTSPVLPESLPLRHGPSVPGRWRRAARRRDLGLERHVRSAAQRG